MKRSQFLGLMGAGLVAMSTGGLAQAQTASTRELKVGYWNTDESPHGKGLAKWADLVASRTNGRIKLRIYSSGQLGSEVQQLGAMQSGSQDFCLFTAPPLASVVREMQVLDFPGLLPTPQVADKVLDGPIGNELLEKLKERNIIGLGFMENGFRQFTNSKRRILKASDFEGLKVRVIQAPIYIDMFKSLQTNPVPMSYTQLYTALETRTVDGQDNPLSSVYTGKFGEVQKYLSLTRHIYSAMVMVGSKKSWDSLPEGDRKILSETFAEARDYQRKVARETDKYFIEEIRKSGVTVDEFPAAEAAKMRDLMKQGAASHAKSVGEDFVKRAYAEAEKAAASTK